MVKRYTLLMVCVVFFCAWPVAAQDTQEPEPPPPLTRILFVFDASQSMYGRWQSDMKINIAQKLLSEILDSLKDVTNLELGLRVYGHQKPFPPQDCNDTRLEVPFERDNTKKIQHRLKTLVPRGTTPIAFALEQAANDFPPCERCRNIIVLITDGIEECGGDPCAASRDLQKRGIALKPFIIGIGKNFKQEFDCVGTYFDGSSEKAFSQALNVVISQALNSTTAQVNLLDSQGNPTETDVNMTFYDDFSGLVKYNFIHTLNNRGLPDTLTIDPLLTYDITVHTVPPVFIDDVKLTPGRHTVIAAPAPQGGLRLKVEGSGSLTRDLRCIVRKDGEASTLSIQYFNQTEKYLTGRYDLEVLTLPRIYIEDVVISQSHNTLIEIPGPGIAVVQKSTAGTGGIYLERGNKLEFVYSFRDGNTQESLVLQPGRYRAVFRSKFAARSVFTIEKPFEIKTGTTTQVKIYE